jgi:PAS domain S-box-containing protein
MDQLFSPTLALHIGCGFALVVLGLLPILSRKGSRLHRWAGRAFVILMSLMLAAAWVMTALHFSAYFAALSATATITVFSGTRVLRRKRPDLDPRQRATALDWIATAGRGRGRRLGANPDPPGADGRHDRRERRLGLRRISVRRMGYLALPDAHGLAVLAEPLDLRAPCEDVERLRRGAQRLFGQLPDLPADPMEPALADLVVSTDGGDLDRGAGHSPEAETGVRAGLSRVSTRAWVLAFTAYSWLMTTVCAAWFARRFAAGRGDAIGVLDSLVWQGSVYAAWLPAAVAVWLLLRRYGSGAIGLLVLYQAGVLIVPLEALVSSAIDSAYMPGPSLAVRTLGHLPVALLLYTAIIAIGLAATHHRRAADERTRAQVLEIALGEARQALAQTTATAPTPLPPPERLIVMSRRAARARRHPGRGMVRRGRQLCRRPLGRSRRPAAQQLAEPGRAPGSAPVRPLPPLDPGQPGSRPIRRPAVGRFLAADHAEWRRGGDQPNVSRRAAEAAGAVATHGASYRPDSRPRSCQARRLTALCEIEFAHPFNTLEGGARRRRTPRMAADEHDRPPPPGPATAADEPTRGIHSRAFLDAVIESIPAMLVVKDGRDGRFVLINRTGEELLGVSREALIGHNDADFFPAEQAAAFAEMDRQVLESNRLWVIDEEPLKTPHNGDRWLQTKKIAIPGEGDDKLLVIISEDITERKKSAVALEAALQSAQAASIAKSEFLANMSHEIRTPLNGVLGMAQVLAQTELTPRQREMMDVILGSGRVLNALLSDILDLAKVEAGEVELEPAPFNLRTGLAAAAATFEGLALQKGLTFSLEFAPASKIAPSATP